MERIKSHDHVLQALTSLERLDFFATFNNDHFSKDVIDGLSTLTSLTRLRLKGTGIGRQGVHALAAVAQQGCLSKLLHLRVETVGVNATAVQVGRLVSDKGALSDVLVCAYLFASETSCRTHALTRFTTTTVRGAELCCDSHVYTCIASCQLFID